MIRRRRPTFEPDDRTFPAAAYRWTEAPGYAVRVLGWETEPDPDTVWSGYLVRTGRVLVYAIGDDVRFGVDWADLQPLTRDAFCAECGALGCRHDCRDEDPDAVEAVARVTAEELDAAHADPYAWHDSNRESEG